MSKASLRQEINGQLLQIRQQKQEVAEIAKMLGPGQKGIRPSEVRNSDGSFALTPLLHAEAMLLSALAYLS